MRLSRETLTARFDAFTRFINGPQLVAVILQIMRPPPEAGRNFQNRAGWQKLANARENCAVPIAQRNCPTVPTIPRPPLSNRTSRNGSQYSQYVLSNSLALRKSPFRPAVDIRYRSESRKFAPNAISLPVLRQLYAYEDRLLVGLRLQSISSHHRTVLSPNAKSCVPRAEPWK